MNTDRTITPTRAIAAIAGALGVYHVARWWRRRERSAIGYVDGRPIVIVVVGVQGKPVEINTAAAFARMEAAAAGYGVELEIVSGFRTMSEQERLYDCYINCKCNNCNLAAMPGFSNHQSGRALDLNTRTPGVHDWLVAHAGAYGFRSTIASEPWHWEYWG